MTSPLVDAEARRRIRDDLDTTFVVEAAAGTGKTTALVGRIVRLVATGRAPLSKVVALTFTERAAGEMKLRLRVALDRARAEAAGGAERAALERAFAELEAASIGTLHSYCHDLLREHPLDAGVDPAFRVGAPDELDRLLEDALEDVLDAAGAPPEGVRRVLRAEGRDDPRRDLLRVARHFAERRDVASPLALSPWDRPAAVDQLVDRAAELGQLAARASSARDPLALDLAAIGALVDMELAAARHAAVDVDRRERLLRRLARAWVWRRTGRGERFGPDLPRSEVLARRARLKAGLDEFIAESDADVAARLAHELGEVVARYQQRKRDVGVVDYVDLVGFARRLVARSEALRARLAERVGRLFVDEFQDTDAAQAELVSALVSGGDGVPVPGKLFVVGDPKQSIYGFRSADLALYEHVKSELVRHGAEILELTASFRAVPAIQAAVNAAFATLIDGQRGRQPAYAPLAPVRHTTSECPPIVALPIPELYDARDARTKEPVRRSFPDAVASFVREIVEERDFRVEVGGTSVRLGYEHVCLLFRNTIEFGREITRGYVRALEERGVPHVLVGGRAYHEREEIVALVTALSAIERPSDRAAVYATLRGPYFGFTDVQLYAKLVASGGGLRPRRPDGADEAADATENGSHATATQEIDRALDLIARLHGRRRHVPIADTIVGFLEETRAHANIASWPSGEQALANVERLVESARRLEGRGATSLLAFLRAMSDEAQRGGGTEATTIDDSLDGVRLMTVHAAKGLEFPVVILCEPTTSRSGGRPQRYVDPQRGLDVADVGGRAPRELRAVWDEAVARAEAEEIRVAYVAATRARDMLVVPIAGDEPRVDGWLDPFDPVVRPAPNATPDARASTRFAVRGGDSVRDRPPELEGLARHAVRPGVYSGALNGHGVTIWSLPTRGRPAGGGRGVRQQHLLREDERGVDVAGVARHRAFEAERARVLARGAEPTERVVTVTRYAREFDPMPPRPPTSGAPGESTRIAHPTSVRVVRARRPNGPRPGGARFGTLVHLALSELPLSSPPYAVDAHVGLAGRIVGATDAEIRAARVAIEDALAHPLLREAAGSRVSRRETAVALRLDDGRVLEGIIDLAFAVTDADGSELWYVVDYKTDDDERSLARYSAQLGAYARAVSRATGREVVPVLFLV